MIVGNLIIANIVGEMSVFMFIITRRSSAFQEKLDIANSIMRSINISKRTRDRVRDFFFITKETLEEQNELLVFLDLISPSLRLSVSYHIFFDKLEKNVMIMQLKEAEFKGIKDSN